jgi:hypothetical protein
VERERGVDSVGKRIREFFEHSEEGGREGRRREGGREGRKERTRTFRQKSIHV